MADLHLGELVDLAAHQRNGTPAVVGTGDLTTHGVIVGMTGSGKTGLGVVLIEEALTAGVSCLLIDPKGDLTNLCLTFPDLTPADFRPWINDGDAQKAGLTPDAFAEQQATTWKDGLAGWGITPDRIKALRDSVGFTIYTPGSTSGVSLNIVGSLQAPADVSDMEVVRDEIEGYVSGLLGLVGIAADPLSSREHILLSNLIETAWTQGQSLDLGTLVGQVQQPPMRKLGVFELDQFFPPADRTTLAIKLNGLLASPSFAAWADGAPLDIGSLLRTADGKPAAAIVTIAHLSDEERQFVVALVLSKLVTWMRKQSGTTDLRTLVYMDEVAGYVPPTAAPPTKKPIMTLMKQARAFGVGVVLATQNPVDIDYKAISNAGTWMVGRLQTERDKARLLDGMSAAAGGVDVGAVGDTISGLAKREFVLRRAGKDTPDVFTTRWAMSYLRGPLTRDQIASLMAGARGATVAAPPAAAPVAPPAAAAPNPAADAAAPNPAAAPIGDDTTPMMPEVAQGVGVSFVDPAAPWLAAVGGTPGSTRYAPAAVARVRLRYDEEKADLVVDEEYEAVLHPLTNAADPAAAIAVDYDERDLLPAAPGPATFVLPDAPIKAKTFWSTLEKDLVSQLVRVRTIEIFANRQLKLFSRAGETNDDFAARCREAAAGKADEETAKLREKYETKAKSLQDKLQAAQDRAQVLEAEASGRQQEELLSTAGSLLGSFLGGRKRSSSLATELRGAAGRRSRSRAAGERLDAAQSKAGSISAQLSELETDLSDDILRITGAWDEKAAAIDSVPVSLERTDVQVAQLALAWVPVT
jgi:Helicase HerA, central domain